MNKFIKLPLFLGSVSLVFCSTLAVVVNVCNPIIADNAIKKEKAAYAKIYAGVDVDKVQKIEGLDFADYSQINSVALVPHNNVESYVYTVTSKDPMSGTVKFMLGLDKATGAIDGYYMVENNNAGYADYYNDNSVVLSDLKTDNKVTSAGITKTQKVVQECVDQALEHYKNNKDEMIKILEEVNKDETK